MSNRYEYDVIVSFFLKNIFIFFIICIDVDYALASCCWLFILPINMVQLIVATLWSFRKSQNNSFKYNHI